MREGSSIFRSLCFTGGIGGGLLLSNVERFPVGLLMASLLAYSIFLWKKGIKTEKSFLLCFFVSGFVCALMNGEPEPVLSMDFPLTHRVRNFIRAIPFQDKLHAELLCALLTGDRSGIPSSVRQIFRDSGGSHLLALSGMHMGIIYLCFSRVMEIFGNHPKWKKVRSLLIVFLCAFYTLAVGAGHSIVRAFLFILLRETSCCLERKTDSRDILCNGLILQLTLTPHALFDVGFQLSYLAMSGITFLFPILNKWYHGKIWESCALSISCQVFTGPLAYLKFGSLPLYFMLTNLISIPLTSLVMGTSLLLLVSRTFTWDIPLLVRICEGTCRLLLFSLELISTL